MTTIHTLLVPPPPSLHACCVRKTGSQDIEFSFQMTERANERSTATRKARQKAPPVERNLDGSLKVRCVIRQVGVA